MPDAEFDDAVSRAAKILQAGKAPVIASLGADVAGIVAAFRLAEKLGAAIDHAGAEWALRDQAVLQDIGLMVVSPGEACQRADTILVVGDRPFEAWPDLPGLLFSNRAREGAPPVPRRQVVALTGTAPVLKKATVAPWLEADAAALPTVLAAVRAKANGRPLARDFDRAAEVESAADILKATAFGVALWSPEEIDALAIEMLIGLIKDLNATTRWSGLSVSSDVSATAAAMASGWMSGLPIRVTFARGRPEHDPWQYDARRLVESGEADAVVWISANNDPLPGWLDGVPTVVLSDPKNTLSGKAAVSLPIGQAGTDHDGIVFDRTTGTLVEIVAKSPGKLPSAADVLNRITALVSVS